METTQRSEPKVVFCTASVGSGHTRAAEAVAALFSRSVIVDALEYTPSWFSCVYRDGYFFATKWLPWLVGWCYNRLDKHQEGNWLNGVIASAEDSVCRRFVERVRQECPDIIVCTHFMAAAVLCRQRERNMLRIPVVVVVTDEHPHSIWLHRGADGVCVSSKNACKTAERLGVRVFITGIPVDERFMPVQRTSCRDVPAFLLCGGGDGMGTIYKTVQQFLKLRCPMNLTVVCGKNHRLKHKLEKLHDPRLTVLGYTNTMHTLMQQSDLLICKPGGLTTTEAKATGIPMLLMQPIPGQEERNAESLISAGAAIRVGSPLYTVTTAIKLVKDRERYETMKKSVSVLRVGESARRVADVVMQFASWFRVQK